MNKENYFKLFAKIYFVHLKEKSNKSLSDFKNWSNNEFFTDFFEKINKVGAMFGAYFRAKYSQKKRLYSLFRNISTKAVTVQELMRDLLAICDTPNLYVIYEQTAKVLDIELYQAISPHIQNSEVDKPNNIKENAIELSFNTDKSLESKDLNVDLIDSLVFGNPSSDSILFDNASSLSNIHASPIRPVEEKSSMLDEQKFSEHVGFSSTKNSFIMNTTSSTCDVLDEYQVIRKRIRSNKDNKSSLPETSFLKTEQKSKVYQKDESEFVFSEREFLFLNEYFLQLKKYDEIIPILEDLLREKFKTFNTICPIAYTSTTWSRNKTRLYLYAKCIYRSAGCRRYRFGVYFGNKTIIGKIQSDGIPIKHPTQIKRQQIRSIRRIIAKYELRHQKAGNWRNRKICEQKGDLNNGNDQEIPTRDVARRIKSEQMRSKRRDNDMFIDAYKMQTDKNWKQFIQYISSPLEVYLFSDEQLRFLQLEKGLFLKLSRDTLFFDATGNVVRKLDKESKRIFLYTFVAHIREKEERGIVVPVAEGLLCSHYSDDIERFLVFLKTYCIKNSIKWPICKRVCSDWSPAAINALARVFNKEKNVHNLTQYIQKCFTICQDKGMKNNLVVIQFCCAHFLKVVYKDIELHFKDPVPISFFKWQFAYGINISTLDSFWIWFKNIFTILINTTATTDVENSLGALKKTTKTINKSAIGEYVKRFNRKGDTNEIKTSNYKKSPFYLKTLSIFDAVKKSAEDKKTTTNNPYHSSKFASLLLTKYSAYVPLWTNIMGKYVDKEHTRVSNSPVESYFNIVKHITLDNEKNLVLSEYIRKSYTYVTSKIKDAENTYKSKFSQKPENTNSNIAKKAKIQLEEDTWKRTPKKDKTKINSTTIFYKALKQFSSWPRHLKETRYILLSYYNLYKNKSVPYPLSIDLTEFKSLDSSKCVFNNVIDIYINILLTNSSKSSYALSCEEGYHFFHSTNTITLPLDKFDLLFIPIIHQSHYTLAYLDTQKKHFYFMNSLKNSLPDSYAMFNTFIKKVHDKSWKNIEIDYDYQTDSFNCGVFVCLYVNSLLHGESLLNLINPNVYRDTMKNVLKEHADNMSEICLHCGDKVETPTFKCKMCHRPSCEGCTKYRYKSIRDKINEICMFCEN